MINRWIYLLTTCVLAGGLVLLVREAWRRQQILRRGLKAHGKVVALHKRTHPDEGTFYHAEIEFVDAQGAQHRFESEDGSRFERPSVGTQVAVRYDPHAPHKAMLGNLGQGWWPTLLRWLVAYLMLLALTGIWREMQR